MVKSAGKPGVYYAASTHPTFDEAMSAAKKTKGSFVMHADGTRHEVKAAEFAMDKEEIDFHGFATTHVDALCHVGYEGKLYNGRSFAQTASETNGCPTLGIHLGYFYEGSPIVVPDGTPAPADDYANYVQTSRPGSRAASRGAARRSAAPGTTGRSISKPAATSSTTTSNCACFRCASRAINSS